jgi:predicted CXXCH cytochrome family protein
LACHGDLDRSRVEAVITLPKGATLDRKAIDRDGNGFVDPTEWHALEALLAKSFKGFKLERQYWASGNVHEIVKKPATCSECHEKRTRFATAVVRIADAMPYSLQLSPWVFIPEFPPLDLFSKTVHGQEGIQCLDCHISQKKIEDTVCLRCHPEVYQTYRGSVHAKKGATSCTDCHNPHSIKSYKELGAKERIAVCSRCHKDYIAKHEWLPNTSLHFDYLECTTCHSPGSEKSMVFFFSKKAGGKGEALKYEDLRKEFGSNVNMKALIDQYAEKSIKSDEIGRLLVELKKGTKENVFLDADIIVTKVHHDYSVTRLKEKECVTCHSAQAQFYDSMYLILPGKERNVYVPAKGTLLSSLPIGMAMDFYLVGAEKMTKNDLFALFGKAGPDQPTVWKSLGFKWIDLSAVILTILVLLALLGHGLLRALLGKKGPGEKRMKKVYLHALTIRIWHWINALIVITLHVTGMQLRMPELFSFIPKFSLAVSIHKYAGYTMAASFLFWLVDVIVKGSFRRYYLFRRADVRGLGRQTKFYLYGIFRGHENPFTLTAERKFNSLQKIAYGSIMFIFTLVIVVTGILFSDILFFQHAIDLLSGIRVLVALHVIVGYIFLLFLVVHIYMSTLGHNVFAHIKAMIVGYEEEPDEDHAHSKTAHK